MSAFKDNLEEQRQRTKYQKEHFWAIFFLSFIFGIIFLSFLGFSEQHWFTFLFYVPNSGATSTYYLLALSIYIVVRIWWNGIPSFVLKLFSPFYKITTSIKKKTIKTPLLSSLFSSLTLNKFTRKRLINGKMKEMDLFFYPKTSINDGLARVSKTKYFRSKKYHLGNIFDYNGTTMKENNSGTKRIISLFRDSKREKIKKRTISPDAKISKRAKELLIKRDNLFVKKMSHKYQGKSREKLEGILKKEGKKSEKGIKAQKYLNQKVLDKTPTIEQENIFKDLFEVIEGVLEGYSGERDGVKNIKMNSPLKVKTKNGIVSGVSVDSSIDVFKDGVVRFSVDMIGDTTKRMTILFMLFLKKHLSRNSRFSSAKSSFSSVLSDSENILLFEDYFKIVFLRRLLLNYGAIPSGWMCIRIEDYTLRAIMSAVDRPLIPTITSTNDGSNSSFNSDVLASAFLFTYWAFMTDKNIEPIVDDLDWCFNTTKDLNEIKARNIARGENQ